MSKDQNKARALEAMLSCTTLTEAAAMADISRRTLYAYIRDDESFGDAYRAACDQAAIEQMEALNEGKARAAAMLLRIMDDAAQPAGIRLKAAQTILAAATQQQGIASKAKTAQNIFDIGA